MGATLKASKKTGRKAAPRAWRMANDDLDRMFALVQEVGQVELKFAVAEESHAAVRTLLEVGAKRVRTVYYLDTGDLTLRRQGVLARVRGGQRPDSVVKLRPIDPDAVPAALRRRDDFTVEVDVTPDSFICSGSLKRRLRRHAVERAVHGRNPLRTLFSDQQLALIDSRLHGVLTVDDLQALGPVEVRRTRPGQDGPGRGLELQEWIYPDRSRLMEVSTRCGSADLLQTAAQAKAFLDRHAITQSGPCPTKADSTLDYFTRR
ncbi:hypothetical protein KGQ19_27310 [Catenulispora sp. NL8]|uniref:CYTH domain-containing protein n=1 Tax=Catenulispora pinistramenti TaxID=2705254 RepID=A0ABS5KWY7_9ACTN|nr:hypothetical protein [Catenulispora pinistramenti]MBS2550586.1 hypothetical protein [Catenulispora pinistramenti]